MTDTITKQEPKLSVRKPGVWRNKWRADVNAFPDFAANGIPDGVVIVLDPWPSAEIAEQVAVEFIKEAIAAGITSDQLKYLGPVFFPEGDDA